jgi:hypothetical protein
LVDEHSPLKEEKFLSEHLMHSFSPGPVQLAQFLLQAIIEIKKKCDLFFFFIKKKKVYIVYK